MARKLLPGVRKTERRTKLREKIFPELKAKRLLVEHGIKPTKEQVMQLSFDLKSDYFGPDAEKSKDFQKLAGLIKLHPTVNYRDAVIAYKFYGLEHLGGALKLVRKHMPDADIGDAARAHKEFGAEHLGGALKLVGEHMPNANVYGAAQAFKEFGPEHLEGALKLMGKHVNSLQKQGMDNSPQIYDIDGEEHVYEAARIHKEFGPERLKSVYKYVETYRPNSTTKTEAYGFGNLSTRITTRILRHPLYVIAKKMAKSEG